MSLAVISATRCFRPSKHLPVLRAAFVEMVLRPLPRPSPGAAVTETEVHLGGSGEREQGWRKLCSSSHLLRSNVPQDARFRADLAAKPSAFPTNHTFAARPSCVRHPVTRTMEVDDAQSDHSRRSRWARKRRGLQARVFWPGVAREPHARTDISVAAGRFLKFAERHHAAVQRQDLVDGESQL